MRNLLTVVDDIQNVNVLIEKSLQLSPESLFILAFEKSTSKHDKPTIVRSLDYVLSEFKSKNNQTEVLTELVNSDTDKILKIIDWSDRFDIDAVMIHRPLLIGEREELAFEKGLLRNLPKKSSLLMCGNSKWKTNLDVMTTLDFKDESEEQEMLNDLVFQTSVQLAKGLSATLHLMSVIAISRVGNALDIIEPSVVLSKEGNVHRDKLDTYAKEKAPLMNYTIHVAAGLPSKEIPTVANQYKADLLVLGYFGRTGVKRLIIGNTAEKILQRLAVDVLIVKKG